MSEEQKRLMRAEELLLQQLTAAFARKHKEAEKIICDALESCDVEKMEAVLKQLTKGKTNEQT